MLIAIMRVHHTRAARGTFYMLRIFGLTAALLSIGDGLSLFWVNVNSCFLISLF